MWNMATYELREAVNESAAAHGVGVDEFKEAGLETVPSSVVRPPRVKRSPVQFECRVHHSFRLPGRSTTGTVNVVIGQVVGVHIADEFITPEGKLDILKCRPIARCGYYDCAFALSLLLPLEWTDTAPGMKSRASQSSSR